MFYFPVIKPTYKKSIIYTRLGYRKTATEIPEKQKNDFDSAILHAENKCNFFGGYIRVNVNRIFEDKIELQNGIIFKSSDLSKFLEGCNEVILMFASAGAQIISEINRLLVDNPAIALIYDATASEATDACLDYIQQYVNRNLIREAKRLTEKRYSCGYGDFDLNNQQYFYEVLNLKEYNIKLTETFILQPEKTVTAIAGIR